MKDEEAYAEHTTTSPEWFVVQDARHSCVSRMPRLRNYGIAAEYGVIEQALNWTFKFRTYAFDVSIPLLRQERG